MIRKNAPSLIIWFHLVVWQTTTKKCTNLKSAGEGRAKVLIFFLCMQICNVLIAFAIILLLLRVLHAPANEDTFLWKKHFASSPFFFLFFFWFAHSKNRFGKQYLRNNVSSLDGDFWLVTHDQNKNLVLSNKLIKVELLPLKVYKVDVSSVSHSSERICSDKRLTIEPKAL